MEYVVDKKWKWVECNLVIKRLPQKQYHQGVYQSLQAQVQLTSQQPDIKNFQSDIIMQKSFEFQEGRGFIWHKSWYIPQILLKLSSKITRMLKEENNIKKIYCQMLSGYPFKKEEHFYLEQVKLDGDTLREFNKKGEVTFSNIKFSQTSFNKNKNKFSIILVIYTSYKENEKSIIKSYISSPIHVDSRKQARKKISANTFIQDEININKFLTKLQGAQKLITQNYSYQELLSIYGFIKYYTAANIRFKIKHPYYIGYHFSNVFDIYYNSEEAKDPLEVLDIIFENQLKENDKVKSKPKEKKELFTDNKEILKKSSPKILLFLIKNTPKDYLLIKDEVAQSEEKLLFSEEKLAPESQDKHKNDQKDQSNSILSQFQRPVVESQKQFPFQQQKPIPFEQQKLVQFQQQNYGKQIKQVTEAINQQSLIHNGLSHILQPVMKRPLALINENQIGANRDNNVEQLDINNEVQKEIKEQENSQFGVEFFSKNGQIEVNQTARKELRKTQLIKEEEAIRKIYSIFESWKFNFVHLKKSDGGLTVLNKKWVYISPDQLFQNFKIYAKKKSLKTPENGRVPDEPGHFNTAIANNYLSYDIHQVIVLQKSKNQVKIEDNYLHTAI